MDNIKKTLAIFIVVITALSCGISRGIVANTSTANKSITYTNPIKTEMVRDPHITYLNGKYYMTATCYPFFEHQGQNPGVKLWSSNDLLNWSFEKILVRPANWYQKRFWAPEIFPYKNKFYLTFNCFNINPDIPQSVGVAVADSINGEYKVLTPNKALCEGNDASLFADDDGKVYLLTSGISIQQIDLKNLQLLGKRKNILPPGLAGTWDGGKGVGMEGPGIIKVKNTYYLFYSSWGRGYEVGYATANNISGPWTKAIENPVYGAQNKEWAERYGNVYTQLADVPFTEVGHGQPFTASDGSLWISCHGITPKTGQEPQLVIDPIHIDVNGKVKIKLTWTPQTFHFN